MSTAEKVYVHTLECAACGKQFDPDKPKFPDPPDGWVAWRPTDVARFASLNYCNRDCAAEHGIYCFPNADGDRA